jgi:hypothetical protein
MNLFGPITKPLTREAFEAWPPHMQTEFALLAADRGLNRKTIFAATGIAPTALGKVGGRRHAYMLPQVAGYHVDDGAPADPHRNPRKTGGEHNG